ncbi:Hypothetical protein PBC10988_8690 [Planctomycetales bacterium 10988]|nr:Hypothetical protein PBC10988_8690 [Planctomycetales bacterium 10988]
MNLTAICWLILFLGLSCMTFRRSSWGIALYLLTCFAHPPNWWWGAGFLMDLGIRWNLCAALIFAAGVALDAKKRWADSEGTAHWVFKFLAIYVINATIVHYLLASNIDRSFDRLTMLWKQVGLLLLMWLAMRSKFDFKVLLYSLIVGCCYIGFEAVVNGRGRFSGARLEGIGIPGAEEANYLAGLLGLAIPLAGGLLLIGSRNEKILSFCSLPLILEVILRCNSRGAFLSLLAGAGWMIGSAKGRIRSMAILGVGLGLVAALLMAKDERILERFVTTFSESEDRDKSADARLAYWSRALMMIGDYPLGSGAEAAFKSDRGVKYINDIGHYEYRAVHNGYLDIAASWGIQGILLFLGAIYITRRGLRQKLLEMNSVGYLKSGFLGVCIDAALIVQLSSCIFISSLDGEWFYWWMALALGYIRVNALEPIEVLQEDDPERQSRWQTNPSSTTVLPEAA